MSSSRLPGKVLLDIAGKPMLQHVVERAQQASLVNQVVLATTTAPADDVLEQFSQNRQLPLFRGSMSDVLDRFYRCAAQFHADVIIRLTADCPLLDPHIIDATVSVFLGHPFPKLGFAASLTTNNDPQTFQPFDFSANRLPPPWQRTLPIGLDVEVCSFEALERAWKQADQLFQREHVMPFLYEGAVFPQVKSATRTEWYIQHSTTPRGFRVALLNHSPDHGSLRWTVDTHQDLDFVRQIYTHLPGTASFSWQAVLSLLDEHPELISINAEVEHKSAFDVDKRTAQLKKC